MAASDATFVPKRNAAYRVYFPILDADGDTVTAAAGLDAEVSKDGAAFADCTNESTEIGASGMYYLDLTATEMDADCVIVLAKTSTSGAKATPIVLYTAARDVDDLAFPTTTGRSIDVTATGEVGVDLDNAAGTLDAAQFGANFLTAAKIDPDVTTELQTGLATAAALASVAAFVDTEVAAIITAVASIQTDTDAIEADTQDIQARLPAALVGGRIDASVGAMAAGVVDNAAIAPDAIGASELAASAVTEIQAGLATSAEVAAVQADTDALQTAVATVNADTDALQVAAAALAAAVADVQDRLPAALVAGRIDASVGAMAANVMTAAAAAADLATELQAGLATAAALAAVQSDTDALQVAVAANGTAIAGVQADTDSIQTVQATHTGALAAINADTDALQTAAAAIEADTQDLQSRVPAALVAGRIDASVGAMGANTVTASALAADAGTELADAILDRAIAEPVGPAAWPASIRTALGHLLAVVRNKTTQTGVATTVRNDADSATLWTQTVSDDGTTTTKGEAT